MYYDKLSMFKGDSIKLTDSVNLKQIKLSDVVSIGEDIYREYVGIFTTTSVDIADILFFDMGIWYQNIDNEWNFFVEKSLVNSRDITVRFNIGNFEIDQKLKSVNESYKKAFNFLFEYKENPDVEREYFLWQTGNKKDGYQMVLASAIKDGDKYVYNENNFKITEHYYRLIMDFVTTSNWIKKDDDLLKCKTRKAKIWKMEDMKRKRKSIRKKDLVDLSSIVSSLITKGQNYSDIWDYPIYLIYDIYYRLMKIDNYENISFAYYNGKIDTKKTKIDFDKINWSNIIR